MAKQINLITGFEVKTKKLDSYSKTGYNHSLQQRSDAIIKTGFDTYKFNSEQVNTFINTTNYIQEDLNWYYSKEKEDSIFEYKKEVQRIEDAWRKKKQLLFPDLNL